MVQGGGLQYVWQNSKWFLTGQMYLKSSFYMEGWHNGSFYSFLITFCIFLTNSWHHFLGPHPVQYVLLPQGVNQYVSMKFIFISYMTIHIKGDKNEKNNNNLRLFQLEILFLIAGRVGFCMIFKEKKKRKLFLKVALLLIVQHQTTSKWKKNQKDDRTLLWNIFLPDFNLLAIQSTTILP